MKRTYDFEYKLNLTESDVEFPMNFHEVPEDLKLSDINFENVSLFT